MHFMEQNKAAEKATVHKQHKLNSSRQTQTKYYVAKKHNTVICCTQMWTPLLSLVHQHDLYILL